MDNKAIQLIENLQYYFSDKQLSQEIGAYRMALKPEARKALDDVIEYLKEASGMKKCTHCAGHGKFGFSMGTGEVEQMKCPVCDGLSYVDKNVVTTEVTKQELDEYFRRVQAAYWK